MKNTELRQVDQGVVLILHGDLDNLAANRLRPMLEDLSQHPEYQNVIIDLSDVDFMDSLGIGALMFLYKRLMVKERKLLLAGVKTQPFKAMKALTVEKVLACYPDVQACLEVLTIEE
ncbi:MAG: STAS domain-containing protein [Pseudomonadota bacterium]